ncbi:MAG: lysylphosphatidylglycerol synthase transmembrane domain-containing protein, partial [Solirubrobacteraceae bacterium]
RVDHPDESAPTPRRGDQEDVRSGADPPATASAQQARNKRIRQIASGVVSLALVVAIFWYFLPQFTSISAVWTSIQDMSPAYVTILVLAGVWNLVTYSLVIVPTMPGLRYREAVVASESSTAVSNTIPGGSAIGIAMNYSMYSSWGFSRSRSSVSMSLSGIWNNFAKLGLPIVALALLVVEGNPSSARVIAAVFGLAGLVAALVLFALMLRSPETARRVGLGAGRVASALRRVVRRPPVHGWQLATMKFRTRTVTLVRARWLWLSIATLVSHVSLFRVLLVALRAVGVTQSQVSWIEALAVFAFARLLTAIPITPGGLGIVEIALISGLAAAGGARAEVAAAVLIFRALTYVLPIPVGVLTYAFWKRNRSWRRAPGTAPRTSLVPDVPKPEAAPATP